MGEAGDRAPLVTLGVTGGIGAYKAVEVARLLQQRGYDVQAVLTRHAQKFIGALTFEAITRRPVITSQWAAGNNADIEHIALATEMRALVVVPATANILGKFANGIADDFLSALHLATRAPLVVAPAMNTVMWEHPAVQANIKTLVGRGATIVEPGAGYLACGWIGKGRLAEPADIANIAHHVVSSSNTARATADLAGIRVLVTAGPTLEDLDPVRFLGNRSSGRMGFAIAREAQRRGATVHLIAGPTAVTPPAVDQLTPVRSAADMYAAVTSAVPNTDIVIMAAAVADYRPAGGAQAQKIEKGGAMALTLERTTDILATLGAGRHDSRRPVLIGFAAQTGDPVPAAQQKLRRKQIDLVVANDVSEAGSGFDVDTNRVTLVTSDNVEPLPLQSKDAVATAILDRAVVLLTQAPAPIPA